MKKILCSVLSFSMASAIWAEKISVAVNPGEAFKNRAPQIAVWVEDSNGAFIDTLFVTKKASANKWIGSPKGGRPESLPDWYKAKGQNPDGKISADDLDATSSATPKKGIVINKNFSMEKGCSYVFKCQVNQSFDYNDFYTKENSGVDGQPAVLYEGWILSDGSEKEIQLKMKSKGDFLTTADKIIESIYVAVK
ncbi:MAG: DUF2271 domain-containing protein [Treponema sp.]|nr:DUF2271 domain-containing protein [Candidatus Treponema equifaecale]